MNKEKQLRLKALLGKIEELLPYASDEGGQRFMEAAVVFLPDLQKQKEKDDAAIGKLMAGNFDDLLKSVTKDTKKPKSVSKSERVVKAPEFSSSESLKTGEEGEEKQKSSASKRGRPLKKKSVEGSASKPAKAKTPTKKKKEEKELPSPDQWDSAKFPAVTTVIKCQGANDDFCIEMLAKKGGQGQQKEFQFLATLDQLRGVDNSEQKIKEKVQKTFHEAAQKKYGDAWPKELQDAIKQCEWAKESIPKE